MPRPARRLVSRRARALTGAALVVCLASGAGYAFAADPDPQDQKKAVDGKLSDARVDLHETSQDLVSAYTRLKSTRAKLPGARSAAKAAEDAETTAKGEYDDAVAAYDLAKANEDKAEKDLKETSSKITSSRRAVAGFAGEVYQQQGLGSMSVAVGSEDPGAFVDKMIMAESVGDTQSSALEELSTSRANLVSTGDKLSALRKKTSDAKATKESKLSAARTASDRADRKQRTLETLESDQTSAAADLRDAKREDQRQVDSLQAQSDKLTKILEERARKQRIREAAIRKAREEQAQREADARARAARSAPSTDTTSDDTSSDSGGASAPDPNPPAPTSSGVLQAPSNAPVSSEFGLRFHPIHQTWRLHAGRDYAGACGSPVYAADSGTIISALPPSSTGGYGNQIVIDHGVKRGTSLATTYNHLQSFAVRSGHVSRGQVIGYVGTTGTSTGCHLHFETRANGTPVDPRGWL
ncbi:peptidoglycan DD-metalloendopeptidase family protein [Janibacter sp. CX7]|uniref:M23 family metallopeptidase n=1 Tax=Janibacter sp. CX7 TaxID=2963431 RepID=UPI0020CE729C|nr:M23 family metallopeptidase [Janibacter sp. CX7]UTT65219.1 peptidoglycan DD-metalloendopeptidase family protein [Janibacter sp. CX7]